MKYGDGWEVDRVRCSVLVVKAQSAKTVASKLLLKAHPGHHILGEFSFALISESQKG